MRPGEPTTKAVEAYRAVIEKSPYREFVEGRLPKASLAHGIGLDLIEPPYMNPLDRTPMEPGMVFTMEPFLYQRDIGFFMIEEEVLVTESGGEVLSRRAPRTIPQAG